MSYLLQINTSIFSDDGESTRLADALAARWRQAHPRGEVVVRDLSQSEIPHLTQDRFRAFLTPAAERSAAQREMVAFSDTLIEELRGAETVVIGLPMYNFGVPSMLKAYFDHIARAGVTFRYTPDGAQGLLGDRAVYVLAARGGLYQGTPKDTQTRYVRDFLGFLGIDDVEFVYAEGLAMGDEHKRGALQQATAQIKSLAA